MSDFASMKVGELREIAMADFNLAEEDAASLKKSELVEHLERMSGKAPEFDLDFEEAEIAAESKQEVLPKYGSPEWQEFIMELFREDELFDGCPKSNALRRVAQEVLGPVVRAGTKYTDVVVQGDVRAVTVSYEVEIAWQLEFGVSSVNLDYPMPTRIFGGVADCIENPQCTFSRHPAAFAETKAMGRAYKTALCLDTVTSEEKRSGYDNSYPEQKSPTDNSKISDQMLKMINVKLSTCKVNLKDIIAENPDLFTTKVSSQGDLHKLSQHEAKELFKLLNSHQ